jgi:hypothetical protein
LPSAFAIAMRSQLKYLQLPLAGHLMLGRGSATQTGASLADMGCSERLAVWTLRQIVGGSRSCFDKYGDVNCGLGRDFRTIAVAMHDGLTRMAERRTQRRLHFGPPGSLLLTNDERALLQALAAAQCGDERTVHASLHDIAPDRQVRSRLASGVMTLAASLGIAGYWLTDAATQV